ncbi:uncharacterized protein LOC117587099 isoform X4 [Drosophila guanche]|uniref:uncharacterized protein LOC117587099 isoform X4 n=1 Tax=Drosophila guanche TaxID=7266 RepID=UPI0014712688|nr:uncharacterized protein LOC117587099 isoform X4 [Drosophila guanche]
MEEKEEATSSTTAAAETEAKTTAAASGTTTSLQRVGSQASLEQASPMSPSKLVAPAPHHYHYIQYPAHYHQQQQMQLQPPIQQPASQCQCPCSCGRAPQMTQLPQQQQQQPTQNGSMAVAVLVHQQASVPATEQATPVKTQSAQSLLNHSYQALHEEQQQQQQRDRLNLQLDTSVGAGSCDCDLECSCAANGGSSLAQHKRSLLADAMLGADEITVSESDNNSTMIKKKKPRSSAGQLPPKTQPTSDSCNDIYHDTELDGAGGSVLSLGGAGARGRKSQNLDDNRPPLPPRPPPRPRSNGNGSIAHRHGAGIKKYVVWCLICGGFSCLLGVLFLGVYFLLHSYTITVGNFETVPTFVPATLLILTGICIMSLARRRNRYSYLIKLSGACGLVSALTCALVTVTTTVLHMSRLQALRECEYAQKTRTCTCYSDLIESQVDRVDKEGVRLVFDSLSDCGVVHGSLYSCLRAIFGLSVAGVLIAVFSCMLVYQLLSHERKKMYWEQLELRCRSLYASQAPPPSMGALGAPGRMLNCRCCEQCHAHRQMTLPMQTTAYPWDEATVAAAAAAAGGGGAEQRFWASQPPGNFYSPNPGGDDASGQCRGGERGGAAAGGRSSSGWSWPRMPWQRTTPDTGRRFRQAAASPDSQYGFSSATAMTADGNQMLIEEPAVGATYNGMPPPNALPYGVWGPPPPYSDPNSPARRGYYQYLQPTACLAGNPSTTTVALTQEQLHQQAMQHQHQHQHSHAHVHAHPQQQQQLQLQRIQGQSATLERMDGLSLSSMTGNMNGMTSTRSSAYKSKVEYENTPSDSDGGGNVRERDRCSNTLPTRKLKKRIEAGTGAKSIGPQSNPSQQRPNVQQLFAKQDHQQPPQQQQQQQQQLQKEISRQSMCSVESEAKTEFTDLSPSTPCGGSLPPPPANFASDPPCTPCTTGQQSPSFVASFPYSSESQCLEAHRRSTKNIHELLMAGGGTSTVGVDSHYEVINDRNNPVGSYQLQRAIAGGSHKHKSKSKTRSREQLDIYGSGGGADRSDWSSDGGRL